MCCTFEILKCVDAVLPSLESMQTQKLSPPPDLLRELLATLTLLHFSLANVIKKKSAMASNHVFTT